MTSCSLFFFLSDKAICIKEQRAQDARKVFLSHQSKKMYNKLNLLQCSNVKTEVSLFKI